MSTCIVANACLAYVFLVAVFVGFDEQIVKALKDILQGWEMKLNHKK